LSDAAIAFRIGGAMTKTPRLRLVKPAGCPLCSKERVAEFRPFCSKRCADIDMGRWLKESYAIPGEPVREDAGNDGGEDG